MSEPVRNSSRAKKLPRYLQMDENQYGIFTGGRNLDNKESKNTAQEINQIAKLFTKFISITNQKAKAIQRDQPPQPTTLENTSNITEKQKAISQNQKTLQNPQPASNPSRLSKRNLRGQDHQINEKGKPLAKNNNKKEEPPKRSASGLSLSIQSDLRYHNMLGQHIQAVLSDSKNFSTEALMKLGVPVKETLQQKKAKENEKKKSDGRVDHEVPQIKVQEKLFKRQSYHVAGAFHIFYRNVQLGPNTNPRDLDPTFKSRKLKMQAPRH